MHLHKLFQSALVQAGVVLQEMQLFHLELFPGIRLSLFLQQLEDAGAKQQVADIDQQQGQHAATPAAAEPSAGHGVARPVS